MKAICTAFAILAAVVPVADTWAATFTLATFTDPSASWAQPLFHLHLDAQGELSSIEGGWAGTGLTLQVPFDNSTYPDATFSMAPVNVSGGVLAGGRIDFTDHLGAHILDMTWVSGSVNEFGLGARDKFASNNVDIGYKNYSLSLESFAFAFTNYTNLDDTTASVTASFTSAVAPEPASLILLGLCGAMMAVRRRHR